MQKEQMVRRIIKGDDLLYTKTYTQTYHINGQTFNYRVPIDCDAVNWLDVTNLTPTGYTFVGWRRDNQANPEVITSFQVTGENTFYAVFKRDINITIKGGKKDIVNTGTQYINNGNISNPNITLGQSQSDGLTLVGYRTDTQAVGQVQYLQNAIYQFDNDVTLYSVFSQNVTVSLYGGSSVVQNSGTKYYNNGNVTNPYITLGASTIDGWNLVGYRTDAQATSDVQYAAGYQYQFSEDTNLYAVFLQTRTLSYNCNVSGYSGSLPDSKSVTAYYNNGYYKYYHHYDNTWKDNANVTLGGQTISKANHTWGNYKNNTNEQIYSPGATVSLDANVTYTAILNEYFKPANQIPEPADEASWHYLTRLVYNQSCTVPANSAKIRIQYITNPNSYSYSPGYGHTCGCTPVFNGAVTLERTQHYDWTSMGNVGVTEVYYVNTPNAITVGMQPWSPVYNELTHLVVWYLN